MVTRITVTLEQPEYAALLKVAVEELRNPQDQLRYILRKELDRLGFLSLTGDATREQNRKEEMYDTS